jgi:ABC-type Fe3+/spermidine/putrescine transport system ATPase subunit
MMLAGFEAVTRGEIVLDGRSINNVPPYKRDFGVVFQDLSERPENAFVARFIGESNRLLGTVREANGHICVVEVEGGDVHALAVRMDGAGSRSTLSLRRSGCCSIPCRGPARTCSRRGSRS